MPEQAFNPRKPELTEGDRAVIEAALSRLRARGGNLFLEGHLEAALEGDSVDKQSERIARDGELYEAGYFAGRASARRESPKAKGADDEVP